MVTAYNFSKLEHREKRLYAIADLNLSQSGLPVYMLVIMGALVTLSLILNCAIAAAIDYWYFNPFQGDDINIWPLLFVVGLPIALGAMLWFGKVSNYRLIQFLYLYFKPRFMYGWDGKKATYKKIKFNAFLENKEVG